VVNIPGFLIGQLVLEALAVVAVLWGLWLLISGKVRREFEDGGSEHAGVTSSSPADSVQGLADGRHRSGRSLPDNSAEASDKG
jgi:hypothetical protein